MARAGRVCRVKRCPNFAGREGTCPEHTLNRHERHYGKAHVDIRAKLLRELVPGAPCPKCRLPMYAWQGLDAAHSTDLRDDPNAVADHLEHAGCNRATQRVNGG